MSRKECLLKEISQGKTVHLNKGEIELFLPHRRQAMKIDEAIYDPQHPKTITVIKHVKEDDPDLDGHYPGKPTLPAYAIMECANLGAALLGLLKIDGQEGLPMSGGFSMETPKRTLEPDETLFIEVTEKEKEEKESLFVFAASAYKLHRGHRKAITEMTVKGKLR